MKNSIVCNVKRWFRIDGMPRKEVTVRDRCRCFKWSPSRPALGVGFMKVEITLPTIKEWTRSACTWVKMRTNAFYFLFRHLPSPYSHGLEPQRCFHLRKDFSRSPENCKVYTINAFILNNKATALCYATHDPVLMPIFQNTQAMLKTERNSTLIPECPYHPWYPNCTLTQKVSSHSIIPFKMLLPGPMSEAANSFAPTVDATRRSSTIAPAKPPPLPFLLGVPTVTSDPALPSTAEIRESVSKLPTISRNSVLVSGCRIFSRLQSAV